MAPYHHDEFPEKLEQMIDLYESWHGHLSTLKIKRGQGTNSEGLGRIERTRRRLGK